jgi:GNAT superfamily N-acetyltransferase
MTAAVRPLTGADAAACAALRLRALREEPDAFSASEEEERERPAGEIAARLGPQSSGATLGAFEFDRLVGFATLVRPPRVKLRHRATVHAMYVAPEARGNGVGTMLLERLLDTAREWGVEAVGLEVTVGRRGARSLYARAGFVTWGVQPRALLVDGVHRDVEAMVLRLTPAGREMDPRVAPVRRALAASSAAIRDLVAGLDPGEAAWKPSPDRWSILEVVNHLADEEVEDFRTRIDLLLHHPGTPWPPNDPEGWVLSRRYAERDPPESLARFLAVREASLAWLASLGDADWERTCEHPRAGRLSAAGLLASWPAHDLLHVRQIARLRHEWLSRAARPHSTAYAGEW